jgi:His Kinase A (phospho-acceptor) domain
MAVHACTVIQETMHKEEMHRLLRTISHEIRNPLQGILGNVQVLLATLCKSEQQEAACELPASNYDTMCCAAVCSEAVTFAIKDSCLRGASAIAAANAAATADAQAHEIAVEATNILFSMQDSSNCSGNANHTSKASLDNNKCSVDARQQLQGGKSLRHPAAAMKRDSCLRDDTSGNSRSNAVSISWSSSELAHFKDMISEIYECALHQVRIL